jgi:hypothetical protein
VNSLILRVLATFLLLCGVAELLSCDCLCGGKPSAKETGQPWSFVVSGDSRNCGDVIMPTIAAGASRDHAAFYWHLGDLRAIYKIDEDMQQIATLRGKPLTIYDYRAQAWDDFRDNQIAPFGDMPFYVGIGNHETILPKTQQEFALKFAKCLQQGENNGGPTPRTYYHWKKSAVDFIYLDNASDDQFDPAQMQCQNLVL